MGHHHNRSAVFPVDPCQELHDAFSCLGVKISGRFICNYDFRPVEQGPCYGYPLLLTSRELVRHLVRLVLHSYGIEDFGYTSVDFMCIFPPCGFQDKAQILFNAPVHKQLEILEYYTEFPSQERNVLFLYPVKFVSAHPAFPGDKSVFCDCSPDYRSLPGTDFADNIHEVSWIYIHVKSVYHYAVPAGYVSLAE